MIIIWTRKINRTFIWDGICHQPNVGVFIWEKSTSFKSLFFNHSSSFHFPAMDKKIWGVRRLVAKKNCRNTNVFGTFVLRWRCFASCKVESKGKDGKSVIVARRFFGKSLFSSPDIFARVCNHGFPEWTSNVRYYRPSECLYLSDAISCGVGGTIALPPVFESDQPKYCCAVLELVTMEQKQDFDLETEKVFQALQVCFHYIYFFNQILDNVENTTQFILRI